MSRIDSLPEAHVQTLAKVLGVCGTGSEISRVLRDRQLEDKSGESTKWKRLYWVFMNTQRTYGCANRMLDFIRAFLAPGRFVGRTELFEEHRNALNEVLSLSGLEFRADGEFARQVEIAHDDHVRAALFQRCTDQAPNDTRLCEPFSIRIERPAKLRLQMERIYGNRLGGYLEVHPHQFLHRCQSRIAFRIVELFPHRRIGANRLRQSRESRQYGYVLTGVGIGSGTHPEVRIAISKLRQSSIQTFDGVPVLYLL